MSTVKKFTVDDLTKMMQSGKAAIDKDAFIKKQRAELQAKAAAYAQKEQQEYKREIQAQMDAQNFDKIATRMRNVSLSPDSSAASSRSVSPTTSMSPDVDVEQLARTFSKTTLKKSPKSPKSPFGVNLQKSSIQKHYSRSPNKTTKLPMAFNMPIFEHEVSVVSPKSKSPKMDVETNPSFKSRLNNSVEINRLLNQTNTKLFDYCVSGKSTQFKQYLRDVENIGRGTFGTVYKAMLGPYSVVIKEALLSEVEKQKMIRDKDSSRVLEKNYPDEYANLTLVNELLTGRKCPNFLFNYRLSACDGCQFQDGNRSCYITFMEPADGDLSLLSETKLSINEAKSILFQILLAVYAIHTTYGMYHADIKFNNIFIKRIIPGGFWSYQIRGRSYKVQNTGIQVFLGDFGISQVFSPIWSRKQFYGTRNAQVVSDPITGEKRLLPITCRLGSQFDPTGHLIPGPIERIEWKDTHAFSTNNKMGPWSLEPDVSVDLNDMTKTPPFELSHDIQDAIRIFTGGQKSNTNQTNRYDHPSVLKLPSQFVTELREKAYVESFPFYTVGTAKYLLAQEMLNTVYTRPEVFDYKIDEFIM